MQTWLPPEMGEIVRRALEEDIGTGDLTTLLTVPEDAQARAVLRVKSPGVVAGLPVVEEVYRQVDANVMVTRLINEGEAVEPGDLLCQVEGRAQSLLTGERVALNFAQRLSGIATKTARFVSLVVGTRARIVDTRKTTPGLRALEKYAVRVGGGHNHRFGLYDAILIKDNHIQASGGITEAVLRASSMSPHTMTITVECDTLEQVEEALSCSADIILLDNMSPEQLAEAVERIGGQVTTEASGGVTEATVAAIAQAGVDIISVGALTHSAVALDISLDLELS